MNTDFGKGEKLAKEYYNIHESVSVELDNAVLAKRKNLNAAAKRSIRNAHNLLAKFIKNNINT